MSSVFDATRAVDAVTGRDLELHVNSVNGSSKAGPIHQPSRGRAGA